MKPHYKLFLDGRIEHAAAVLRSHQQAADWLSYQGITVAQWARERGFSEALCREVLAGRKKCLRGQSHNIAVALGMKAGVPTTRPARVAPIDAFIERTTRTQRAVMKGAAT